MKTILFITILMMTCNAVGAQDTSQPKLDLKAYYAQKSKKQATTAIVLMGVGAALETGGYFLGKDNFDPWGGNEEQNTKFTVGWGMIVLGTAAIITSTVYFINSGVNRSRAKKITLNLKMEEGSPIALQGMGPNCYPALSVRVALK